MFVCPTSDLQINSSTSSNACIDSSRSFEWTEWPSSMESSFQFELSSSCASIPFSSSSRFDLYYYVVAVCKSMLFFSLLGHISIVHGRLSAYLKYICFLTSFVPGIILVLLSSAWSTEVKDQLWIRHNMSLLSDMAFAFVLLTFSFTVVHPWLTYRGKFFLVSLSLALWIALETYVSMRHIDFSDSTPIYLHHVLLVLMGHLVFFGLFCPHYAILSFFCVAILPFLFVLKNAFTPVLYNQTNDDRNPHTTLVWIMVGYSILLCMIVVASCTLAIFAPQLLKQLYKNKKMAPKKPSLDMQRLTRSSPSREESNGDNWDETSESGLNAPNIRNILNNYLPSDGNTTIQGKQNRNRKDVVSMLFQHDVNNAYNEGKWSDGPASSWDSNL